MKVIKINATESTNVFIRNFCSQLDPSEIYCVKTDCQSHGRGQMGNIWNTEDYKNLTVSYLIPQLKLLPEFNFYISMLSSLAIISTLKAYKIPNLHIKWPNDILSGKKKICGILIENNFKNNVISQAIIGIGLNVNQTEFYNLPKASSLKNLCHKDFEINEVFDQLNTNIESFFKQRLLSEFKHFKKDYYAHLLGYNKVQSFELKDGTKAAGIIKSVSNQGLIKIEFENETTSFELKEIKQLY